MTAAQSPRQYSAVLDLSDSRISISQNRTVQRLTYLTIIYLPMGLMAVSMNPLFTSRNRFLYFSRLTFISGNIRDSQRRGRAKCRVLQPGPRMVRRWYLHPTLGDVPRRRQHREFVGLVDIIGQ